MTSDQLKNTTNKNRFQEKEKQKTTLTRQVLGRGREAFDMLSKVLLHGVFPGFLPSHWTPALKVWNHKGLDDWPGFNNITLKQYRLLFSLDPCHDHCLLLCHFLCSPLYLCLSLYHDLRALDCPVG